MNTIKMNCSAAFQDNNNSWKTWYQKKKRKIKKSIKQIRQF